MLDYNCDRSDLIDIKEDLGTVNEHFFVNIKI